MVEEDPEEITTLKQCGMWKFFQCPFMRAQPRLLNHLNEYWNLDVEEFILERQSLVSMTKDIYFLTILSRRGDPVNLKTFPPGPYAIAHYIATYSEARTEKVGSQVPIQKSSILSFRVTLYMIERNNGFTMLHQASRGQINCDMQCLQLLVFDWSTIMLHYMKSQLIHCK